jgi:hypothetical protein
MATLSNAEPQKELIGLENEFWRALRDGDVSAAVELTDFPCILTGAQGVSSVDEATFTEMMKGAPFSLDSYEIAPDATVRLVNDDVAIVAYTAHEELTVEGKPTRMDVADVSTWIRRDGKWRCAQHAEAILGDPFGRDRPTEAT